jgi:hypothetical protein
MSNVTLRHFTAPKLTAPGNSRAYFVLDFGSGGWIRTYDLRVMSLALYLLFYVTTFKVKH